MKYITKAIFALGPILSAHHTSAAPGYPGPFVSTVGTASVSWTDPTSVYIRNFHVDTNADLVMNSYDTSSGKWKSEQTGFHNVKISEPASIVAVSTKPLTPEHEIRLFYRENAGIMRCMVFSVATGAWTRDQGLPDLNYTPRAAVAWTDSSKNNDVNVRVYLIESNGKGDTPGMGNYQGSILELDYHGGQWQWGNDNKPLKTFPQNSNAALAAITWGEGQQIRLYYYNEGILSELVYDRSNLKWADSEKKLPNPEDRSDEHYPLAAITWQGLDGTAIRLYRNTVRDSSPNVVSEWQYDSLSDKWTSSDLPKALIKDTDGEYQPSAVVWVKPDSPKSGVPKVHVRLYPFKCGSGKYGRYGCRAYTTEHSFDEGTGWTANTAWIGGGK